MVRRSSTIAIVKAHKCTLVNYQLSKHVHHAQIQDRAVAGIDTMRTLGSRIGQRITLQGALTPKDGSGNWPFEIVGTYQNTEQRDQAAATCPAAEPGHRTQGR